MKKHYLIIANGVFLVKEILLEACLGKVIIALDGAANKLKKLGIKPDVILGDFDSIQQAEEWGIHAVFDNMHDCTIPYLGQQGIVIVPRKNQDLPDIIKAIHYCDKQSAQSITMICALGGRMDLHETAMRALRTEYKKHRIISLLTEQQTLRFAKNETLHIEGKLGDYCGVLAYPSGTLTSRGLKYSVTDYDLSQADSVCNPMISTTASVTIQGEALVVLPPILQAQRDFMSKSEVERIKLLLRDLEV